MKEEKINSIEKKVKKEKTFEESLQELEKIAIQLEKGELDLENSIVEFEKGMKLSKECTKKLDDAEKRINILVQNEYGNQEQTFGYE
ncbi:MAG: exodeoxyribonuclease VII small subunit [Clostridia bacterium]